MLCECRWGDFGHISCNVYGIGAPVTGQNAVSGVGSMVAATILPCRFWEKLLGANVFVEK